MKAKLNPDVIRRAIVLKKAQAPNVEFEALIPTKGFATDHSWLRPNALSHETDAKGEHIVLWRKNDRIPVYAGDVIFPLPADSFIVVPEEIISYLRPALYRMLDAEGFEPEWITQALAADEVEAPVQGDGP